MNKKGFIVISALSLVLGAAVAVGAQAPKALAADAWSGSECGTTWYIVGTINGQNWGNWNQFTLNGDRYEYTFSDNTTVKFKLKNVASWSGDIEINAGYGDDLDWNGKGWTKTTENDGTGNFQTKIAGSYTVYYDKNITGYGNGIWAFGIEGADDPSSSKNSFYVYDPSGRLGSFANIKVHGFDQAANIKPSVYPGTHSGITQVTLGLTSMYQVQLSQSYPSFVIGGGTDETKTNDVTDLSSNVGKVLHVNSDGTTYWEETSVYTDYPASNGYYLVGTRSSWTFTGATKLDTVNDTPYYAQILGYSALEDEEFKIKSYFDGVTQWFGVGESGQDNYVVASDGSINVFVNKSTNKVEVDVGGPTEEGYYIQTSAAWGYASAIKMNPAVGENVADYLNFSVSNNLEARVVRYRTDSAIREEWANVGTGTTSYGSKVGDNYKFSVAEPASGYRVYAKYEGEPSSLNCYFAAPLAHYTIEITGVLFNGSTKDTTVSLTDQTAYEDVVFNPAANSRSNYVERGFFTDENCTTAYTPHVFAAAGHLYEKFVKEGFYVIYGPSYNVETQSTLMLTDGIDPGNKAEASITVAAANACYSFVYYDGEMSGHAGLGQSYDYAQDEDSHIKFTATGTYAIYWSNGNNKIYLNEGLTAFYTTFLTVTEAACSESTREGRITELTKVWSGQATAYSGLKDGEKEEVQKIGFDGGDPDSEDPGKRFMARYARIITNYGTSTFNDFVFNVSRPAVGGINFLVNNETIQTSIILIAVLSVSAVSVCLMFVIKRRKEINK